MLVNKSLIRHFIAQELEPLLTLRLILHVHNTILKFKIITWRAFNLEYFFVYEFESKFLSNCILCVRSSIKNGTKTMSMSALHEALF